MAGILAANGFDTVFQSGSQLGREVLPPFIAGDPARAGIGPLQEALLVCEDGRVSWKAGDEFRDHGGAEWRGCCGVRRTGRSELETGSGNWQVGWQVTAVRARRASLAAVGGNGAAPIFRPMLLPLRAMQNCRQFGCRIGKKPVENKNVQNGVGCRMNNLPVSSDPTSIRIPLPPPVIKNRLISAQTIEIAGSCTVR